VLTFSDLLKIHSRYHNH
jgi:hypothetical protein